MTIFQTRCVAHRGAAQVARPNSIASFDAALACGADMIEFDVMRWRGQLICAHDPLFALRERRHLVTLDQALAHLSDDRFANMTFNVDIKFRGYAREVVEAVERAGLLDRCLFSSQFIAVLREVKRTRSTARVGLSVGGSVARLLLRWPRTSRELTERIVQRARELRCDAVMLFHELATRDLKDVLAAHGCELFCWTVDCPTLISRLRDMGVAAVITNDPTAFANDRAAVRAHA
jgi:glycerophosphoryl diester phosphodiesterase